MVLVSDAFYLFPAQGLLEPSRGAVIPQEAGDGTDSKDILAVELDPHTIFWFDPQAAADKRGEGDLALGADTADERSVRGRWFSHSTTYRV